jgi:hypothetical protein
MNYKDVWETTGVNFKASQYFLRENEDLCNTKLGSIRGGLDSCKDKQTVYIEHGGFL